MNKRLVLKIYGQVQGVNFRWHTRLEAERLGLAGWVRNKSGGSVSIIAEGPIDRLQNFLDFCYNGVKSAGVSKIDEEWEEARGEFTEFEIRG